MTQGDRVSIAALLAAGVPPRPHEAVGIVLELCSKVAKRPATAGVMPAISASTVSIDGSGAVSVKGGIPGEDDQSVLLIGRLLLEMLDHSATPAETPVPPRLRATAFRAASDGRAAFASLADLVSALRRHGPGYAPAQAIGSAFERWVVHTTGSKWGADAEAEPAPVPDWRRDGPTPDIRRRVFGDAGAGGEAGPAAARRTWARGARALLVAMLLLVLAGAGFVFLAARPAVEPPFVVPVPKPKPTAPRREPGWELLRQPERVSASPVPQNAPRKASRGERREQVAPSTPDAAPSRQE
jgi:hypothetical protein